MNIFDQYNDQGTVDLTSAVQPEPLGITAPMGAVRNRAALTTLLNPDAAAKPIDLYQTMMSEAQAGVDFKRSLVSQSVDEIVKRNDMKGVLDILSDPDLPFEEKQKAIQVIRRKPSLQDLGSTLFTNSLAKPVAGENADQEVARLSTVEAFDEMYRVRAEIQGLVNAHGSTLRDASAITVGEIAEHWVLPFGSNKNVYQTFKASKERSGKPLSMWEKVKAFALAGSNKKELADRLENLPFDQKKAFAESLIKDIQANSHILMNDNQFAQFQHVSELLNSGAYSSVDKFLDNFGPLLDIVGIGQTIKVNKASRKVIPTTATPPSSTPKTVPVGAVKPAEAGFVGPRPPDPVDINLDKLKPILKYRNGVPDIDLASLDIRMVANDPSARLLGGSGRRVVEEAPQKKIAALLQRVEVNNTVRVENPVSPAKIVQQANPETATNFHVAVLVDETDETAQALYGTSRQDALASDVLPQMTNNGAVVTRPPDLGINLRTSLALPEKLLELLRSSGATEFTRAEKERALSNIQNDFRSAEGLTINDSMSSFMLDGGQVKIGAVYGAGKGSFSTPEAALAQAKLALRHHAVTDDQITLLRKEGLEHVPVSYADVAGKPGNYLVRIETTSDIDVSDVGALEKQKMNWNFFDRLPQLFIKDGGSATRHLFDAASVLPSIYTGPAVAATYRTSAVEKFLLNMAGKYGDQWKALDKDSRAAVDSYIREANHSGLKHDVVDLRARGFSFAQIKALETWREFWDAHYFMENSDLVRTLNAQGFQIFNHNGTTLFAKQLAKDRTVAGRLNAAGTDVVGGQGIFNPTSNTVTRLTASEIDDLYTSGGYLAKLRRPADFGGVTAEIMIVRNTPQEYLRKIKDHDMALNYRPGYFQIQYNAPQFVDEILETGANGEVTKYRTVAVGPDKLTVEVFKNRMASTTGNKYRTRGDDRAFAKDSDSWWDVNSASGRIAQRQRGKMLESADGVNQLGDGSHIISPVDSAMRAARSVAGRVVTRPVLETAKARAIQQYADVFPSNGMGGVRWPRDLSEIGSVGEVHSANVRDARTVWEYVNYLENGYINGMDNTFKALLGSISEQLGQLSVKFDSKALASAERGINNINEASGGPVSFTKNFVFLAYIGSNVLRQLIVQPHQILRTLAYNPVGWTSGAVAKNAASYLGHIAGAPLTKESKAFVDFVEHSGILANVDKQNLVRGVLTDAAHSSNALIRKTGQVVNFPRKIGFDIGEMGNMLGHAAAVYDKFKRAGRNMADKAVLDEATSELSAISYGMNFAEDMPYNQTSAALVLQFMQIPHKAFLQITNRRIDPKIRARMLAADVLMWGGPALLVSKFMGGDILSDDESNPYRQIALDGLESMLLNEAFNVLLPPDSPENRTKVDFSSLAPYDISGWMKVGAAVMEGGVEEVLLSSPAANLLFKDGSKVQRAMLSMGRFFNVVDDSDTHPEEAIDVLNNFMKIMSGYSNAAKGVALLNGHQKLNDMGVTVERRTEVIEAWAQILGFGTDDVKKMYDLNNDFYKATKANKEEAMKMYKDVKRMYQEKLGLPDTDPRIVTALSSHFMQIIKKHPEYAQMIQTQLSKDFAGKDQELLANIVKAAGIPGALTPDKVRIAPIPEKDKEALIKHIKDINKAKQDLADMEE